MSTTLEGEERRGFFFPLLLVICQRTYWERVEVLPGGSGGKWSNTQGCPNTFPEVKAGVSSKGRQGRQRGKKKCPGFESDPFWLGHFMLSQCLFGPAVGCSAFLQQEGGNYPELLMCLSLLSVKCKMLQINLVG